VRFLMLDTTEYLAPKRTFLLCSDRLEARVVIYRELKNHCLDRITF